MTDLVRIVPVSATDGAHKTQGTQVWMGDTQIKGITRIELIADVNDVWRAVIHCVVAVPEAISAEASIVEAGEGASKV